MSSRQLRWMREQLKQQKRLAAGEPEPSEAGEEEDPIIEIEQTPLTGFSELQDSEKPAPIEMPDFKVPPAPKPQKKKPKQRNEEEDIEELLLELARDKQERSEQKEIPAFSMRSLNPVFELKAKMGQTTFDMCTKLPKAANSRFISRLKTWPKTIKQYFVFKQTDNGFQVDYTNDGTAAYDVFRALQRNEDIDSLLALARDDLFSPPLIPILCQSELFRHEYDRATEACLRGLYILQNSLPASFVPLQSKLVSSPARLDFLDFVAFLARFTFRRGCYETSSAIWRFGVSLTTDDPTNFLLQAAVPAIYAKDSAFIDSVFEQNLSWRGIPVEYIPDWSIAFALKDLPDDIEPLTIAMARWSFMFVDSGVESSFEPPPLLQALGEISRRRLDAFFRSQPMDETLEIAATMANDFDESEFQAIALSVWISAPNGIDMTDFNEESSLPI